MANPDDDPRLDRTLGDITKAGYDLALVLKTQLLARGPAPDGPVVHRQIQRLVVYTKGTP